LDRFEFILTMHLVCLCLEGRSLPQTLPISLIPPNKRGGVSEPLALMPPPSLPLSTSSGLSDFSVTSPTTPSVLVSCVFLFLTFCHWSLATLHISCIL
uniref:EH domain-containing protein n=1 Tax=Hydatigena taeniaeformis TaxID=6205 RepID=A0A0R3WY06_HYDTA